MGSFKVKLFLFAFFVSFLLAQNAFAQTTQTPCTKPSDCSKLNQLSALGQGMCYDEVKYFDGSETLFTEIDKTGNTYAQTYPSFKKIIPTIKTSLLLNNAYTDYLQTGKYITYKCSSNGFCEVAKTDPYAEKAYKGCTFGCILNLQYSGKNYSNICVTRICAEGRVTGTDAFCDTSIGNNIYYKHQLWWCDQETRIGMICGDGGHCVKTSSGTGCIPVEYASAQGNNNQNTQYALLIPSMDQPIMVVAYQNGKAIAQKPVSNLSAEKYVLQYGPVSASQAYSFAQSTGLATMVASIQRTGATTVASRSTGTSASTRGINYSIAVTPTAPAKNKASPSNYRASSTITSASTYWQPATTTTYKQKTTVSAYKPATAASSTAKKTTAAASTTSSAKRISTTTIKRTSAYRTTATTAASATTTTRKRAR
ncbi:MAG: hypothetical protein V1493_03525 [Candidatus Diapherotrites archaeon]